MTHKLLVVTFQPDLQQFKMFCHCLAKNWQGTRDLVVVTGRATDTDLVEQTVKENFDQSWAIQIQPTRHPYANGDIEQQINKIYYSVTSGVDDVVVFDSKDFLLRPCDFTTFKRNERYRVTYKIIGKRLVDMGYDLTNIVDQPVDHLPAVSNLTPWIWNVDQLGKYWDHLNNKFGPHQQWTGFPAGNEIYGYYVYTCTDSERTIKFLTHPDMPLLIAGGWTHQSYEGMQQQAREFELDPNRIVWKHSRKLLDPRCLAVTQSVLANHGIDPQLTKQFLQSDLVPT
jgi:hypothetical protein